LIAKSSRGADRRRPEPAKRSREQNDALVIDVLAQSNGPIGAYEIARRGTATGYRIEPTQIYRVLSRLIKRGLVHRFETIQAFILKTEPFDACLICDHCHSLHLITYPDILVCLAECAREADFVVGKTVVEIHGCCALCSTQPRHTGDMLSRRAVPTANLPNLSGA
jgi:Fur family transcriptional regulator, zinc uptake regulator